MNNIKKELDAINLLFSDIEKYHQESDKYINDKEADALYVLYKNLTNIKYDLEDYLCEFKYKTNINEEFNSDIQQQLSDYEHNKMLFKMIFPQILFASYFTNNKKPKKNFKCSICNKRFITVNSLLQHKKYKHK